MPEQRSALMKRVGQKNTKPELALRRLVWGLGYRYRLHDKRLPGTPDLVLSRSKTAIFVHGCFWHSHPGCRLATVPKSRPEFWIPKLAANVERDRRKENALRDQGWNVLIVWECELRDPERVTEKFLSFMTDLARTRCA